MKDEREGNDNSGKPPLIGRRIFGPPPGSSPEAWKEFMESLRPGKDCTNNASEAPSASDDAEDGLEVTPAYLSREEINPNLLLHALWSLTFVDDDPFLSTQATNIAVVEDVICGAEYSLLREWFELERTPSQSVAVVSALSQMWIFGLYELLRTWRERFKHLRKQLANGMLKAYAETIHTRATERNNTAALVRSFQAKNVLNDEGVLLHAEQQWRDIEHVWRAIESLRMNLAKHAAAGGGSVIPMAPGYGRINRECGAIDYQVVDKSGEYIVLNRRDIADALRACVVQKYSKHETE